MKHEQIAALVPAASPAHTSFNRNLLFTETKIHSETDTEHTIEAMLGINFGSVNTKFQFGRDYVKHANRCPYSRSKSRPNIYFVH